MSIVYNRYLNTYDHAWYDSSNILYSKCYDCEGDKKSLKIVFKGGRTYLYKDVDVADYIAFRSSESTGKAANDFIIKKYQAIRLQDTTVEELDNLKEEFINDTNVINEALSNLNYRMEINDETGEFILKLNDKTIYEGIEGQVSIIKLLNSMNIVYATQKMENRLLSEEEKVKKFEEE